MPREDCDSQHVPMAIGDDNPSVSEALAHQHGGADIDDLADDESLDLVLATRFSVLLIFLQARAARIKILYHLFMRPYAAEEVWLRSLAEKLHMDEDVVSKQLAVCKIDVARSKGTDYVKIPGPKILKDAHRGWLRSRCAGTAAR